MAADEDTQTDARAASRLLVPLQEATVQGYGIVAGHNALLLMTQSLLEVDGPEGYKRRCGTHSARWNGDQVGPRAIAESGWPPTL